MIPEHIIAFIRSAIRSIWGLEALLLMRAAPDRSWTAEGLTAALRGAVPLAEAILEGFVAAHITVREEDGSYRYAPDARTKALVDELVQIQAATPLAVAKAILLGNDKVQTFVDAFKFK